MQVSSIPSPHSRIDRESFQKLLASAFLLQESGMEMQYVAALLQLQRSISNRESDIQVATGPEHAAQIMSQAQLIGGKDEQASEPACASEVHETSGLPDTNERYARANMSTRIAQRARKLQSKMTRWNAAAIGLVAALVLAGWFAYSRAPVPKSSSLQRLDPVDQQISVVPAKSEPSDVKRADSAFRRVRVSPNEVDDIAEDVTIRHFNSTPVVPQTRRGYKEVRVGDDVTIRYFASKTTSVSPSQR